MATVKSFEELKVWQEASQFAVEMYHVTGMKSSNFDRDLASQLRRASTSIPSNIAEGFEKNSRKEFIRYLYIAKGSAGEVRTQLHLAKALNYLTQKSFDELYARIVYVSSMISKLINYLKSKAE